MYLIYFDEVKDDSDTQKFFWVGGIAVPDTQVIPLEHHAVADISQKYFDTRVVTSDNEFHAAEIYHRKRTYKGWTDPIRRITLIGELLKTLNDDLIKKIYVRIERKYFKARFSSKRIDEMAFMIFCEKANVLMQDLKQIGMLIGDRESSSIASRYAENLSNWRTHKTEYELGTELNNLIDTVHFTESHHSRLLQLADIHIWCQQFRVLHRKSEKELHQKMLEEIAMCGNALRGQQFITSQLYV